MSLNRIEFAKEVIGIELSAINKLTNALNESFNQAVDILLNSKGKIVVTGIGKSGVIGRKFSSTLSSTGTSSFFLHPAESSHGDLGMVEKNDVVVAISYGGNSDELLPLFSYLQRKGIPLIGLTGNSNSKLAEYSTVSLDISVEKEACPLNLAPTASSTVTLVLCDALAMVLLKEKGFKEEDFAQYHPGGSLGRKLLTKVKDIIPNYSRLPLVKESDSAKEVLNIMTTKEVRGICGVVDNNNNLVGAITDGDIRRWLSKVFEGQIDSTTAKASDLMSSNPKVIGEEELAQKALYLMEQFSISSLFVLKEKEQGGYKPFGIIHIQDLLDAKLA